MHFTRLRLTGFKSFVDAAELAIEPGLTGIVGPNGCGKSNLVEALQWVMGEASAKRMRGGDMDDVIFGGSGTRPSRNLATVTLAIDNADHAAPEPFSQADELQIERRIERGKGSTYRINGRETRARDVQILFADVASGAQSASLIGQGRIGWLINAKPAERRALIEEAAGIGGLQARRHEAELKLAGAETNLARLADIAETMESQGERLRKQARQAERYRKLTDQLRLAEALVLERHWRDRARAVAESAERLRVASAQVEETSAALATAQAERAAAAESVPALRAAHLDAAQAAERALLARQTLETEQRRLAQVLADGRRRLGQIDEDLARESQLAAEAEATRTRLEGEEAALSAAGIGEADRMAASTMTLDRARRDLESAEASLSAAMAMAATRAAERAAVLRRLAQVDERRARLARQRVEAEAKTRELDLLSVSADSLIEAAARIAEAERAVTAARETAAACENRLREARIEEETGRRAALEIERREVGLRAERDALARLVATATGAGKPLIDCLTVTKGFEAALGAALGEDLLVATEPGAALHWTELPPENDAGPTLPEGTTPLAEAVTGPPLLARRLGRIGIVPDDATGSRLQPLLRAGQALVTRGGAAWRWDGLTQRQGAPTAAAVRLAQRNRLAELTEAQAQAEAELGAARLTHEANRKALQAATAAEAQARTAMAAATQALAAARQTEAQLQRRHAEAEARRRGAVETLQRLDQELTEINGQLTEAGQERDALPEPGAEQKEILHLRAALDRHRAAEQLHRRDLDRLQREGDGRAARLAVIAAELRSWHDRLQGTERHRQTLQARREALEVELTDAAAAPERLEAERRQRELTLTSCRAEAQSAAQTLRAAEGRAQVLDRNQEIAAARHAEAREQRVRAEALHEQAVDARTEAARRVMDSFGCPPEHLPRVAGVPVEPGPEPASELEARFERCRRDREAIGPVNLMAESELEAITGELTTIRTESADLTQAIARLRQGIGALNAEGRERLTTAFAAVDRHFQTLFGRLFGGGHAHLELLIPDGDPLNAGIEIMASPPGKKLQLLSLLSGGERALTALALVFAVFLTNPAPICVLDEVDAPLDDANVERFCQLVREIGERTGTRFLIVTHHRVTMAGMDRLYGVTMVEKGISALVSVALATAEKFRQTA